MEFTLPLELATIVNEYAKPIGIRLNWRTEKSPSCLAIQQSDEFRDFRTTIVCGGYMGMYSVSPQDQDITWKEWCYWNAILMRPRYVSIDEMIRTGIDPDYVAGYWKNILPHEWNALKLNGEQWLSSNFQHLRHERRIFWAEDVITP